MKNEKYLFLLFSLTFFFFSALSSQNVDANKVDEEVIDLDQLGILNEDGTISTSFYDTDRQIMMKARQRAENQRTGSYVYVEQQGNRNVTEWLQQGPNNTFKLKQDGNDNVHTGYLRGEDNLIEVLQQGNNNKLTQELEGTGIDLDVSQFGNKHELIHIEKSGTSPAYQIHQEGDHGMKIKIEHEKSY